MPKVIIVGVIALALTGCASTGSDSASESNAGSKSKQNCETVVSTGGRLGRKVCTPAG